MRNDDAPDIRALLHAEAEHAPRPAGMTRDNLRRARTQRAAVVSSSIFSILLAVTGVAFAGTWIVNRGSIERAPDRIAPLSTADVNTPPETDGCPVTVPPQPGFVPPKPYPSEPPDLYDSVWYGTAELWTMLSPEGEIWEGLPQGDDGRFTEKTFWWSEGFPTTEQPAPTITLTGRRLDRPGSFETARRAGGGFREDIGDFMLVGVEIPAGCWELTATYRDAELSYVVLIQG